jgi:hypothetical protein
VTRVYRARPVASCSGCGGDRDRPGQAFCKVCHAADMKKRRAAEKEQRRLASLRGEAKALREAVALLKRARMSIALKTDVGGLVRKDIGEFVTRMEAAR